MISHLAKDPKKFPAQRGVNEGRLSNSICNDVAAYESPPLTQRRADVKLRQGDRRIRP